MGRSAYCSIVLDNALASRQHCMIRQTAEGLTLTDLSSTNGTRLNGTRVEGTVPIRPGDSFSVGSDTLEVFEGREDGRKTASKPAAPPSLTREPGQFHDETSTATNLSSIELIEALVRRGGASNHLSARAAAVEQAVDTLLDTLHVAGVRMADKDRARLRESLDSVVAWFPDGSRGEWRARVEQRLAGEHGP